MNKNKRKKHIFLKILLAVFLIIIFTSAILFVNLYDYYRSIDANLDTDTLFYSHGLTTKIYVKNKVGAAVELESQRLYGFENRIFADIDTIPEHVKNAFIAIEDHRFYEHNGVDIYRTGGAVLSFISPSAQGYGGSTITQQLVKNLTGDSEVTVKRKLTEIKRATELEKKKSKSEILEMYLNTVYLSQGCYGIETAAEKYFEKKASELTIAEGASLAAIIQYPTRYDPIASPENNNRRKNIILARMNELGLLSDDEYHSALAEKPELKITQQKSVGSKNSWFTDSLIEELIKDLCNQKDMSRKAASALIYGGGLTVYTTMNVEMQEYLENYYLNSGNFPKSTSGEAQSSAVIMDKNGAVLAIVGGRGEKSSDRIFNLATQMLRSPGSVIKPVSVYAPAIDRKLITWATVFDDIPTKITKLSNGNYSLWPKNNPRIYSGLTTVNQAIKSSTNTVAVNVLEKLGKEKSFMFLRDTIGISTLVEKENKTDGGYLSDIAEAPLALGALSRGASLLEMTAAYTMFPSSGICSSPHFYTEVYDKEGKLLLSNDGSGRKAISAESAEVMTEMMKNVVSSGGTASCITLGRKTAVAGKTGTSNANTDRWFIGYTPDLVCGVWYGFKDARDVGYFKANPAAQIFDAVMGGVFDIIPSSERHTEFSKSGNVVTCLYCKDSGLAPSKSCILDPRGHRIESGYFIKGTEPKEKCATHKEVKICSSGGVSLGECDEKTSVKALIKVLRSFPCQIKITDSQYVYRDMPPLSEPSFEGGKAYFESILGEGEYCGTSGVANPYNRACPHYRCEYEPYDEKIYLPPEEDE